MATESVPASVDSAHHAGMPRDPIAAAGVRTPMSTTSPFLARLSRDYVRAGDLYYQRGDLARAAEMYARGRSFEQAARVSVELGDQRQAIGFLVEGGNPLRAAELLVEAGDHKAAIALFEKARAFDRAAEASLALHQPQRAAQFFDKAGMPGRAAGCYEKAGEIEAALAAYERESRTLEQRFRGSGEASLKDQRRQVDLHRATLLARVGRPREAADILLGWGLRGRAAELFEKAGDFDRAARSFLEADQPQRALQLVDRAKGLSPLERARLFHVSQRYRDAAGAYAEAGRPAEAADAWEAAGEWRDAAAAWEVAGDSGRAAELYFRIESWRDAARCYAVAGRLEVAAEAYARIPDHRSAASCFREVGRPLEAARHFLEADERQEASAALQEVAEGSPDFQRATLMLVPLLLEEGLHQGALHRLALLGDDPTATGTLAVERLYWQARALEAAERIEEARDAYQKVLALRRDHRDSAQRLDALRKRASAESTQAVALTPPPLRLVSVERGAGHRAGDRQLAPGDVLAGRYLLVSEIGRGGMGRVFQAEDRELGEPVAIKTLVTVGSDGSDSDRLLRELQICRKITHSNVVRVFDLGRFDGGIFITMEFLRGETLDKALRAATGGMPLAQVRDVLRQILSGLQEAHRLKVVHRDLKPSNILLAEERLKILDFGIARMEGGEVDLTIPGEVLGSPKYMSPEQIQGEPLDGRSDLYSLGVLTFAMLTGREPFTGKSPSAIAIKQLRDRRPRCSSCARTSPSPGRRCSRGCSRRTARSDRPRPTRCWRW